MSAVKEYTQQEIDKNMRDNVIAALKMFASRSDQFKFYRNVPIADILEEILLKWSMTYESDDEEEKNYFISLFTQNENKILSRFDEIYQEVDAEMSEKYWEKFVNTSAWCKLYDAARNALKSLNLELPDA